MAQHREVKDSLIFNEEPSKNKNEQNKKKTDINDKQKSDNKGNEEHSFYNKQDSSEKNWFKRHLKAIIIIFIIFIILLALGLGLGLGLSNKKEPNQICIGGVCYRKEQIKEYIIDKQSRPAQYETKYLKDNSVIWAYQILINDDLGSQKDLDDAENKADNQINDEKDTYRDEYGNDWKDEWEQNLLSKGFDTEGQYRTNLISTSLLSSISDITTSDTYLYFDDKTDSNSKKYRSTLETGSSRYYALNGDYQQETILYDDPILNKTVINHQFLFDFYQKIYKPISYEDILIPFTFETPLKNGLISGTDSFALTVDNVDDIWVFLADLAVISYQAINGASIDDWEFLDFKNPDYTSSPSFTDSGVTTLSDSIASNSTVSLILMEIYGNLISENYNNPDFDLNTYDSSQMFQYYYSFHEEVALEYRDVFKDIYGAYGETLPITNLNKYRFFIPAYGATTSDGNTWSDDPLPSTDIDKYNSINDTFSGENTDTYISNLTSATAGAQVVAQINKGFYAKVDSTTNLISKEDRQIFYHLTIPTINYYNYDGTSFTFSNVKANITDSNANIDNSIIYEDDYYLTQSIDGMHLVHNNVLNQNDPTLISDAQVMLAYQLDQKLLQSNPNPISQLYQYDYDILSSYQSWLSLVANDLIFNQYLNYVNNTYNLDGGEFSDAEKSAFEEGEDLDWDLESDPSEILNQFYNQLLWDDISKTTSQVARSNNFFEDYGSIYLNNFDIYNWDASLHQLLSYFSFEGDSYELKTIDQLYDSGNLSN
ncbi:MAG: hypothetical protein HPPSJP_4440 [Candidatus Hepatoplasma scabrum]|nr:MAG: hypothetical protein HPPSJP_4440 [Candidatus Hepatoplasma sp.]